MKKILIKFFVPLMFIIFSNIAMADDFCDGFEAGYKAGYKQVNQSSFDPFTPFCPFKPFKRFSDPESDFEFGYTIGYRKGLSAVN